MVPAGGELKFPAGIKPFTFDGAKLARIGRKLFNRPQFWPDNVNGPDAVAEWITNPNTVMLEIGDEDGLIAVQDVASDSYCFAHIVVFNRRRVMNLIEILNGAIPWFFRTFNPLVISAWIPATNRAACKLVETLDGWQLDGQIRQSVVYLGKRVDERVYSITRDDCHGIQESITRASAGSE